MGLFCTIIILLTLIVVAMNVFAYKINASPSETKKIFSQKNIEYEEHFIDFKNIKIRAISTGNEQAGILIVFAHGAPGAWNAFRNYLLDSMLLSKAQLISIDRIGYGYSANGQVEKSIVEQVNALKTITDYFQYENLILVGHSYGGPIVGSYAARFPEKLSGIIMLAPVIDPEHEKQFWINNLLNLKFISWMLPGYLNVSVQEKISHAASLKQIESDWSKINVPVIHMHCSDDWIAPAVHNVAYSKAHIPKAYLHLEEWKGAGHLIPFNSFEKVRDSILNFL
jgi:pimeloyl-ACP methyl ester carboxylesterase